jgi:hypothetical protein
MTNHRRTFLGRVLAGVLELYVRKSVTHVRRRWAQRFARLVGLLSGTLRGLALGVVVAALGACGLALVPVGLVAGVMALCYPAQTRLGLALSAAVLLLFAVAYALVSLGAILYFTAETQVRKRLGADEIERRIAGE